MKLFHWYLLREWAKVFLTLLLMTLGLLVLENVYRHLRDFLQLSFSLKQILDYYCCLFPTFLPIVLPVVFLLSLLYIWGSLNANSEIIVLRASGWSLMQIAQPLLVVALLLCLCTAYLTQAILPRLMDQLQAIEANQLNVQKFATKFSSKVFHFPMQHRLWFFSKIDTLSGKAEDVVIHQLNEQEEEIERYFAQKAHKQGNAWVLENGQYFQFGEKLQDLQSATFEKKFFPQFQESPALLRASFKHPRQLSLNDLKLLQKFSPLPKYAVMYFEAYASSFMCLCVFLITLPFAVNENRRDKWLPFCQSIFIFFGFYFLSRIFNLLGEHQILKPMIAAWSPSILLVIICSWIFRKSYLA